MACEWLNAIKENFETLTSEFDEVMRDLQFSTIVSAEEQREIDSETLREEIADMKKVCFDFIYAFIFIAVYNCLIIFFG